MNLLARMLVTGAAGACLLVLPSGAAHAEDWLVCPGTENTATVCVAASPGDPGTTQDEIPIDECVNITHPNCEVPVQQSVPVLLPALTPAPSVTVYVECLGGGPCAGPPITVGGGNIG